jgi:hypothetical protein
MAEYVAPGSCGCHNLNAFPTVFRFSISSTVMSALGQKRTSSFSIGDYARQCISARWRIVQKWRSISVLLSAACR